MADDDADADIAAAAGDHDDHDCFDTGQEFFVSCPRLRRYSESRTKDVILFCCLRNAPWLRFMTLHH
eukprot:7261250-Karenia_brevis.AAC.1